MTGPSDGPPMDGGPGDPTPHDGAAERPPLPPHLDPRGGRGRTPEPVRPRHARNRKRIAAWIAAGLAGVLIIGGITGLVTVDRIIAGIHKIDPFGGLTDRPSGGVKGDLNILLVGSDSRQGLSPSQQRRLHVGHDAGQRSDTMILLHIPRGGGRAVLVSLPRDSYVTIPRHRDATGHIVPAQKNKLNTAYAFGGARLTVATIEYNTHVRIDHYVEINFLGFVKMVDALGGVTVCTPTAIHDPVHYDGSTGGYVGSGLELPKGKSKLNGIRALEYVRAREFDPSADLGRIQRQQRFMSAMVQKAKSAGVLLDPPKLISFINAVAHSLTTDQHFGISQIKRLALDLRNMSPAHVEMIRMPLKPGNFNTPAGNVVEWDPVLSRQLFRDLTLDLPVGASATGATRKVTIAPSAISVPVLNATSQNGLAARAANALATLGFHISRTGNAPHGSDPNTTVVRYGPSRADSAKTLAAALPGAKLVLDQSLGSGLQVIIGTNYHGVQHVTVAQPGETGTVTSPRTAAQDICS